MRIVLVVIFALSLALLGSTAGDGGQVSTKPTLKLSRGAPLTVRGANFRPSEKVRVTVKSERTRTKLATATGSGVFVVRFQDAYDRCSGLLATAIGDRGSRAMLKLPQPMCPPRL
jgi:hypothetical protein